VDRETVFRIGACGQQCRIEREAAPIIDLRELSSLCGFSEVAEFQQAHRRWVDDSLTRERMVRDARSSEAIAVGNLSFVEKLKSELGYKAAHPAAIAAVQQFKSLPRT
jgi:hypothetical protein